MGIQFSKQNGQITQKDNTQVFQKHLIQMLPQNNPQSRWRQSSKTIQDLKQLMRIEIKWPSIIRQFVRKISNKKQYQRYLRAILEQIIQQSCDFNILKQRYSSSEILNKMQEQRPSQQQLNESSGQIQRKQKKLQVKSQRQKLNPQELLQLFNLYKHKLQQSYFVVTEKGSLHKNNQNQMEFELALKQLESLQKYQNYQQSSQHHTHDYNDNFHILGEQQKYQSQFKQLSLKYYSKRSLLSYLMLTQLYQYSSVKQNYINQVFLQLNIKFYHSLEQFIQLLIQEFILVEDQFNLCKFIIQPKVLMESLEYLQLCTKIIPKQAEKQFVYQEIKKIKENPLKSYIKMCYKLLKYKNVHAALVIMHNLVQKGYHLGQKQLELFFYLEAYNLFIYGYNFSKQQLKMANQTQHQQKRSTQKSNGYHYGKGLDTTEQINQSSSSFISFINQFQHLSYTQILHVFFLTKSYSQLVSIKKCYLSTFGLYYPQLGESLFLKHLFLYALSQRSYFITCLQSLKNNLQQLSQQYKQNIQQLFLKKLLQQSNNQIIQYSKQIIQIINQYNFSSLSKQLIHWILKIGQIFNKFQITLTLSQLSQFLLHNSKYKQIKNYQSLLNAGQHHHGIDDNKLHKNGNNSSQIIPPSSTGQQLQFLALILIKKVIVKYFTLNQSKQMMQVRFTLWQENGSQSFQYTTSEIQSIFILSQYLYKNIFSLFLPLPQLHQLLFQHMLHFYKYEQVERMLMKQNVERYNVQVQVIKMIIVQNIREMLIKSQKNISIISKDIKIQFKILDNLNPINNNSQQQQQIQNNQLSQYNLISQQQQQQLQSIKSLYLLLLKLDFYSISLNQQQKENISIKLLYYLIEHYEHQIEVFVYDEIYRLICKVQGNNHLNYEDIQSDDNVIVTTSKNNINIRADRKIVTNQYLKFKIDLAHLLYQKGKIKFGQQILKQVLVYQPPWISTQIIKIIQKSPHLSINQNFLNIAFQYCVKGQDLIFLLNVWKKKTQQKNKKSSQQQIKITQLFESTQKFITIDDEYVKDQKQYRNLVAEMTFNDEILKQKDYELFFALLGTEPERAFYSIYNKKLDIVKIEIVLKQGMKQGIFNIVSTTKMFFKLLYFFVSDEKSKMDKQTKTFKTSFLKFKNIQIDQVMNKIQNQGIFKQQQANKQISKTIPYILLKKMHKSLKSLLILPSQFIQNYIQNFTISNQQDFDSQQAPLFYMFLFDQNYREKHLIGLKDQPMGKNDIRLYKQLCTINGLNILDLILFNFSNLVNTVQSSKSQTILQQENVENMLQKLITWTQNNAEIIHQILSKLIQKIFSSQSLYNVLCYLRQKENPLMRQIISSQHMQILESLKQIQLNTQFHGIINEQYFSKPISLNPKQNLSEKHIKILKKQLKLRNVFLISKIMYFCYGMSNQVQKQVLKLFVKENQNQNDREIFEQLKKKVHEAQK